MSKKIDWKTIEPMMEELTEWGRWLTKNRALCGEDEVAEAERKRHNLVKKINKLLPHDEQIGLESKIIIEE